ncbi:hypothetical protein M409DRAFT_49549 [Zasmidium cellare ATCC 36951]|uniref:Uncharacterized protein n=1 Tax=Zasmidium cellare ATCC 36951 TaxID=1080233 RepID=A0A6A6D115_ZASCE|nr:uncharacterized protein M409DRAFT_49549 [Zasmidium cellare ATCC 36951]KAF2173051.1 hypothetical protein M409DRAFT_49549 [Zasmidium cellare ATCC 36951]
MASTECATLLETIEKQFLAGNISDIDFTSQLQPCLPQACDQVYGSAKFDLVGTGFYYSTLTQVAVFVLCGPFQVLVSRCLSPHARTSTNLSLARFQSVLDTAYTTGTLLAFAIMATGFTRTSLYAVAALERSVIRDMADLHSMLQNLAMASYILMKTPAKVTRGSRAWGFGGVYLCCQILNFATWSLKRRINATASVRIIGRLCTKADEGAKSYPELNLTEAPGWNPLIVGAVLGVVLVLLFVAISVFLPKVWSWIEKLFSSVVLGALIAVVWIAGSLLCVGYWMYHLTYTRDGLEGTPDWDLGQVLVVAVWLPTLVQLALAILMTLTPERGGVEGQGNRVARVASVVVEGLYSSWFGKEPRVEEDKVEEKKPDDKAAPQSTTKWTQTTIALEKGKAPRVSSSSPLDDEKMARNPSPGAQV